MSGVLSYPLQIRKRSAKPYQHSGGTFKPCFPERANERCNGDNLSDRKSVSSTLLCTEDS